MRNRLAGESGQRRLAVRRRSCRWASAWARWTGVHRSRLRRRSGGPGCDAAAGRCCCRGRGRCRRSLPRGLAAADPASTGGRRRGLPGRAGRAPAGGVARLKERAGPLLAALLAAAPQRAGSRRRGGRCRCCGPSWRRPGRGGGAGDPPRLAAAGMALETPGMRARPTRPGLCRRKGAVVARAAAARAAGGEAWVGDETVVRAFPPLRAAWSNRGAQAVVAVSGRNAPRTSYGALRVASGEPVDLVRERARTADAVALAETVGAVRPGVPRLLVWDNAPSHAAGSVVAGSRGWRRRQPRLPDDGRAGRARPRLARRHGQGPPPAPPRPPIVHTWPAIYLACTVCCGGQAR